MPVDTVSELSVTHTGDNSGANTGRRRARRTTGASGSALNQPLGAESATQQAGPGAPMVRSPLMEALDNLTDDITDVPAGGHLPPIRLPPKPTRVVAPLPLPAPPAGQNVPGPVSEPPFFYVQKARGFKKTKGWPAMFYPKHGVGIDTGGPDQKEQQTPAEEQRQAENELLEVGLIVQRIQQTTGSFICGFLAGFTSWYAVASQLLYSHLIPRLDGDYILSDAFATFVIFYQAMSMPVGCVFYLLLAFCLLTIFDRYDVSFVTRKDVLEALRLQNGALPLIILYLAALIVTLVCTQHDARMYLVTSEKLKPVNITTAPSFFATMEPPVRRANLLVNGTSQRPLAIFQQNPTTLPPQLVFQRATAGPQPPPGQFSQFFMMNMTTTMSDEKKTAPEPEVFDVNELDRSVTLWLRLNFARAACCTLAWLVMVISSDPDRISNYLRSLMEVPPPANNRPPQQKVPNVQVETAAAIPSTPANVASVEQPPKSNNDQPSGPTPAGTS